MVGDVRNLGNAAVGVELQVIVRDASGRLVDVAAFCSESIDNILRALSYSFRHHLTREHSAARVEVQVVGTQVW